MILDFSKWKKLNEQQAAAPVNLEPTKYAESGTYLSDGRVGYTINSDGSLSLVATNKKTNKAVTLTLKPSEMSLTSRDTQSTSEASPIPVASYAEAIPKFLAAATDFSIAGEAVVKLWGAETAKLVEKLSKVSGFDNAVKSKIISTTKNNLFVVGGDANSAATKFFRAGIASVLPSTTFGKS